MTVLGVLAPGARVIVRDEEWLVRSSMPVSTGGYAVRVVGLSELVRNRDSIFMTELDDIVEMRPGDTKLVADTSPQYRRSRLYLESLLRRTPPTDDRVYLGHKAAIDPARYQEAPTHQALAALRPRILIADGVGIGKTIEVGILLCELIKRGKGERILVVALKSLLAQFQHELWTRFSIPLVRLDSEGLQRVQTKIPANKNPFYYFNRVIISIDTLKNDYRYRSRLEQCRWDVIIIDECHHVANADTQRNRLASLLARTCDAMILTSATPHNGRAESFANLMNMLDPTAIANPSLYTKEEIRGLFVRRFKKDVEAEVGEHFRTRKTVLRPIDAAPEEEQVFTHLNRLKFHTLDRKGTALRKGRTKDILFKTTLFKAFLSSPHACLETVEQRIKTINERLQEKPANRENLENDLSILEMVRDEIRKLVGTQYSKLTELRSFLDSIGWDGKTDLRVIVFSERKRTLDLLEEFFRKTYRLPQAAIAKFHAGLPDWQQTQIVEDFGKKDAPVRVLIATDVASEGVNLHYFCNHVIHFDIPWSLISLEQRNGRIDRYGQDKTPHVVYLLMRSHDAQTRGDLRILDRLIEKEAQAHENIGDVATLLGLHDPSKEEEYIESEVSSGTPAEEIIPDEPDEKGFLDLLAASDAVPAPKDYTAETSSLFGSDMALVKAAFDELLSDGAEVLPPDFAPDGKTLTFEAPEDLKHRCQFIPNEAVPKGWEFALTTDRPQVMAAISEARRLAAQDEHAWPALQLLWEFHPVMQWLLDKVSCRFERHEAPVILVPALGAGRAAYVFQGVMSNRRSQPVIARWFAVNVAKGKPLTIADFADLIAQTGFDRAVTNPGKESRLMGEIEARLKDAVDEASKHMTNLARDRRAALEEKVEDDRRRFERWYERAKKEADVQANRRITAAGRLPRHVAEQRSRTLREIEERRKNRHAWLNQTLQVVATPYLKLAAVFVGE